MFGCRLIPDNGGNGDIVPNGKVKLYGMVNYWMYLDDYDDLMKTLKDNKVDGTWIELLGADEDNWVSNQGKLKQEFKELVASARKYDRIVFVNIVNWNSDTLTKQSDAWFMDWLATIKEVGSGNLIIQAASEWDGSKAQKWCSYTESQLTGYVLSWNKGSRPTSASSAYKYIDYHAFKIGQNGPNDTRIMVCTDTSPILAQMMIGGSRDGQNFDPNKVKQFAETPWRSGKSVVLYGFRHKSIDKGGIQALGSVQ